MLVHSNTVIIICGPTAVGKTALAIKLAQRLKTEIISADSRQCYKELNIGVAKPTSEELEAIQHHFINSHHIFDNVNAVDFEQYALGALKTIFSTNTVAVMVGGTGLYIKAFTNGLDEIPGVPAEVRAAIVKGYEQCGLSWLQEQVREHDPDFWQKAEQSNPQRLMRALEVKLATKKSINEYRKGVPVERPFNIIKIGLELPRSDLFNIINTRVDAMMTNGLLEEVKELLPFRRFSALQTVGYRELFNFLDGNFTLEQAVESIKTNTRHYAKRQLTWFKKDPSITWYTVSSSQDGSLADTIIQKTNS